MGRLASDWDRLGGVLEHLGSALEFPTPEAVAESWGPVAESRFPNPGFRMLVSDQILVSESKFLNPGIPNPGF